MNNNLDKNARRAAVSGFLGAMAEYYDFALYAPAAVLFLGPLFFEPLGDKGASLAALATFAVAYIARPVGALIFGNLGDHIGRSRVLLLTLSLMGAATVGIGCLPTYHQAGVVAPILLVILRILQGLCAGVEQSGSGTLSAENAPRQRRAIYTSWTMIGVSLGWFLGPAVLTPLSAHSQWLMAWGWRLPFWLALVLLVPALIVRAGVTDAPGVHARLRAKRQGIPVLTVMRHYPLNLLRVIGCSLHMLVGVTFNIFVLGWAVTNVGLPKPMVLACLSFAGLVTTFTQPFFAWLSDVAGRKVVFISSCLGLAVALPLVFLALYSRNQWVIGAAMTGFYLIVMAGNVVQASFYPEMFPAEVRLSGVSVGTQLGLVVVGLSPLIYSALAGSGPYGFVPGCVFAAVCWLIAAGCAASAPETAPSKLRGRTDLMEEKA
ncbi:MAG: MFS transporter [Actinomycetaceae bacterium]|nr:MFS transporter [Actinomycetaceae bacterium]